MSKVDMKVFEDVKESSGYSSMSEMIYTMCEGGFYPQPEGTLDVKYPSYSLKKSNPEEYDAQYEVYRKDQAVNEKLRDDYKSFIGYNHLHQDGGGEGGAESCEGVFELKGKIYRAYYTYYSYNGHEYDYIEGTLEEVKPVEKTVIVYESV